MLRLILLFLTGFLTACGDHPLASNTDVGLRVWVEASPRIVSISDTTAEVRLRLMVQNSSSSEITVITGGPPYHFTGNPARNSGLFGSIRIANNTDSLFAGPSVDWWGQPIYTFAPRSYRYDEIVVSLKNWGPKLRVGEYRARGWFNGREGQGTTFVVKP